MDPNPIARGDAPLILLVALLRRGSLSTDEARRLLGDPDRKRSQRALKKLRDYAPLRRRGQGRNTEYVLDPLSDVSRLTLMDRVALRIGRDAVAFLDGTLLFEGLEKATDGAVDLPGKFAHRAEPEPSYLPRRDDIDALLDGLVRERRLSFAYGSTGRPVRDLAPLSLVVYRRALYLFGRFPDGTKTYNYRIDRMASVEVGAPFDYPAGFDIQDVLQPWFGIYAGAAIETVVMRFSAKVGPLVEERRWHPTARTRRLPDGRVELTMETGGIELERFALEWGEHCEVVAPPELRARVIASLRGALGQYGPTGTGVQGR